VSLRVEVVEDAEAAARVVAERLVEVARAGGHLVLTGGETPTRAYELAAELEPDWSKAEVWWGDERCVPPDDDRSNYGMTKRTLLDRLERPPSAIHRIRGEDPPEEAAAAYEEELRGVTFDLVLNGLGPDVHTASLFPNAPTLEIRDRLVVPAKPGLEPFVERVTLTIPALENCRAMVFLSVGEEKTDAARRAFGEPPSPATPASLVRSKLGETVAVLDRAAAGQLSAKR
jgi:6-phosphogluconolactonase